MKIMRMREKVSKFVVVTMASALVISSMFTDRGISTHANETADPNVPELESVSGGDYVVAIAAEPLPLYNYAAPTDNFAKPDLANPFLYSIYANTMSRSDHVEGNVAIGSLPGWLNIWGSSNATGDSGVSYIGDLSTGAFLCNARGTSYVVIPETNADGTSNKLEVAEGQGYRLHKINAENVEVGSFITDNLLKGFAYQNDIKSTIANTISSKASWARELYSLPDMDTGSAYVLNITAETLWANFTQGENYESKIVTAADAGGKTVIINILDSGEVTIPQMNANGASDGSEYAAWAGRVLWNFGNASKVNTSRVWGYILAPGATVANGNNIIGGVIANDFQQSGEVHQVNWSGVIPTPPTPTDPPITPDPTDPPTQTEPPQSTETPTEPTATPEPDTTPNPEETPGPNTTPNPEETPGPDTTPEPEETPGPNTTPNPEETPGPDTTPNPEETPGPNTTPNPEETPGPDTTPNPEETPGPNTTPDPEETPGPDTTPNPEETPGPDTTPNPEETPGPNTTPDPEETPGPDTTPNPEETPGPDTTPNPEETPGPDTTPNPEETPGPDTTPNPEETPGPDTTPDPEETPGPDTTPNPEETPGPDTTPDPEETPGPETPSDPEETPGPTEPTPPPADPTPPPSVTMPPQVTDPPVIPDDPTVPEIDTPTPTVLLPTETPVVNGMRRTRTVRIEDDEIPLSDAMVLGARRRPQTGDESDAWTMMFLASLSALAAWILKGFKK